MSDFRKELAAVINSHSKENGSNTPDFILAEYLEACLENFDNIVSKREVWYERPPSEHAIHFDELMTKNLPPESIAKVDPEKMYARIMERFVVLNDELMNKMPMPNAETREEIRGRMKAYFPTCTIKCDEENNPPEFVYQNVIFCKVMWKKHPSYEEISYVDLLFGTDQARSNFVLT